MPSEVEKAWTAGFVDGEGCISVLKSPSSSRGVRYRLVVSVTQVNRLPLERMLRLWGGAIYQHNKDGSQWKFTIANDDAKLLLSDIVPYLVNKREEANVALMWNTMKVGEHANDNEKSHRTQMYAVLQELKKQNFISARQSVTVAQSRFRQENFWKNRQ